MCSGISLVCLLFWKVCVRPSLNLVETFFFLIFFKYIQPVNSGGISRRKRTRKWEWSEVSTMEEEATFTCSKVSCGSVLVFSVRSVPVYNSKFVLYSSYTKIGAPFKSWFVDPSQDTSQKYSTLVACCWLYKRSISKLRAWTDDIMIRPGMPRRGRLLVFWTWKIEGKRLHGWGRFDGILVYCTTVPFLYWFPR